MPNHPEEEPAAAVQGDTTHHATVAVAVSPLNPDVVYATATSDPEQRGHTDLFLSRDGGATWTNTTEHVPDYLITDIAIAPYDDRIVYVVTAEVEQGSVFKTTDGGETWTNLTGGLPQVPAWAVATYPTFEEVVYVINDAGSFVSDDGGTTWTRLVSEAPGANAATPSEAPARLALAPVAPNPVQGAATVAFQLPRAGAVRVVLYDVLGREVAVLVDGERAAGAHTIKLGTERLAAGAYVVQLTTDGQRLTQRLTVVR